jgi:hypothetical protein
MVISGMGIDFLVGRLLWLRSGGTKFGRTAQEIDGVTRRCVGWAGAWYEYGSTKSRTTWKSASKEFWTNNKRDSAEKALFSSEPVH